MSQLCYLFLQQVSRRRCWSFCAIFLFSFFMYTWAIRKKKEIQSIDFFFFFCSEKLMEKSGRKMRIDVGEIWNRFAGFFIRNSYKLKIRDGIFCIKHAFRKLLRIIWCRECVSKALKGYCNVKDRFFYKMRAYITSAFSSPPLFAFLFVSPSLLTECWHYPYSRRRENIYLSLLLSSS